MKLVFAFCNSVPKNSYCRKDTYTNKVCSLLQACQKKRNCLSLPGALHCCVCVKGHIETYHTRKNYKANVHFTHIEQKNTDVTSDQNAGNLPLVLVKFKYP